MIFTVEERVFDQVIEDLENRKKESNQPVHVINIDVADNHEDATLGAFLIVDLAQLVCVLCVFFSLSKV